MEGDIDRFKRQESKNVKTEELDRGEAIGLGLLEPIEGREDEYLFKGKPKLVRPEDKIQITYSDQGGVI